MNKYWLIKTKTENYKRAWLKINKTLEDASGIYILTREDENGFKFAYIGQAKEVLTRLAQHSMGYNQHIDKSLRKHKLFNYDTNPHGWAVEWIPCPVYRLDDEERFYIKRYADLGCQMRNETIGGQDKGKVGLGDGETSKGYYDGLKQGYKNCLRDIRSMYKYLKVYPNQFKNNSLPTALSIRKEKEFIQLMEGEDDES